MFHRSVFDYMCFTVITLCGFGAASELRVRFRANKTGSSPAPPPSHFFLMTVPRQILCAVLLGFIYGAGFAMVCSSSLLLLVLGKSIFTYIFRWLHMWRLFWHCLSIISSFEDLGRLFFSWCIGKALPLLAPWKCYSSIRALVRLFFASVPFSGYLH